MTDDRKPTEKQLDAIKRIKAIIQKDYDDLQKRNRTDEEIVEDFRSAMKKRIGQ